MYNSKKSAQKQKGKTCTVPKDLVGCFLVDLGFFWPLTLSTSANFALCEQVCEVREVAL